MQSVSFFFLVGVICSNNQLISLPDLNENLKKLYCRNNQLISLPILNEKLELLYCFSNKLTSLPILNENLEILWCEHNQLTSLPQLNENLRQLYCDNNQLTSLPHLNEKLKGLYISDNPISEIINGETTNEKRIQIQILNNFRHLYYSLKFKKQFRDWLWVKIREPKTMKKYHPSYLLENLQEDTDLNDFLDNWL